MIGFTMRPPNPQLRPRYTSTPRATTPQPRVPRVQPLVPPRQNIEDQLITDPYLYNHGQEVANYDDLHNNDNAKYSDLTRLLNYPRPYDSFCHYYNYVRTGGNVLYKGHYSSHRERNNKHNNNNDDDDDDDNNNNEVEILLDSCVIMTTRRSHFGLQ
eukprot:4231507-Amphidinium_carterae.1